MTLPIVIVSLLVLATLALTWVAARHTANAGDHYVAGQRISGWQNGLALAGDKISDASFLGITGAVALTGFGGFYLAVGIPTAYLLVLLVIAEPLRNLGRFTLADAVGGDVRFAIVAGVTITTILAVLAGLAIAASGAVAHDLYTNVIKRGDVTPERQLRIGRVVGVGIAAVAIVLALGAKNLNIAFLANVAFAIAASTTMPVLLLTIYWRGFNRTGATAAMVGGLTVALVLVCLGPDVLGKDDAIFPLSIPAIVSVPAGCACAWLGALAGRGREAATGMPYDEFVRRAFPGREARFSRGADRAATTPARPGDPTPSAPGASGGRAAAGR